MSSIVQSVTGGGANNANFTAKTADLQNPTTAAQATAAYDQTQQGLAQQQAFLNALQAQNGVGNQSSVFNQLQGVANGTGPNPAQAQLAQATGANTANQAALMAGQRGSGANAGLIARQAAMQGGANQQQAAGQAATLQAQQSLNAMGQLGGIAGQQVAQQQSGLQQYNQAAQGQQQNLLNSINGQNSANVQNTSQANGANVQMALQNGAAGQKMLGNVMGAAGTAVGLAEGGPVSKVGQHFHMMAKGGKVPALVSPGQRYLPPQAVKQVEQGANPMAAGEKIPGKPAVGGAKNSYANDTVPKTLDEGGIVLPRSVTKAKDPKKAAHKFVEAILAKQGKSLPSKGK